MVFVKLSPSARQNHFGDDKYVQEFNEHSNSSVHTNVVAESVANVSHLVALAGVNKISI